MLFIEFEIRAAEMGRNLHVIGRKKCFRLLITLPIYTGGNYYLINFTSDKQNFPVKNPLGNLFIYF